MAEESAKLRIPYIAASQAQKHVTHNEAMTLLDTLVQLSVLDKDLTAPPGSPAEGDTYIVAEGPTGAWLGWDNRIARYIDGAWRSYLPGEGGGAGWLAWVLDEDAMYRFDGAAWALAGIEGPEGPEGPAGADGDDGEDGQSFQPDAVVALIAGRDAYDDEAAAFSVLVVADSGNGNQPTLYFKLSAGSADWSDPITWLVSSGGGGVSFTPPQGRLTLESGVPVSTADQTTKTAIYYTPAVGAVAPFWDGAAWSAVILGELTFSLDSDSGHSGYHQADKNFDLFLDYNGGSPRLVSGAAWANDTTRGYSLTRQDGVLLNAASMTVRFGTAGGDTAAMGAERLTFVGTFRTTGTDGQTEDSHGGANTIGRRLLWNAYNRKPRPMRSYETAVSWSYTSSLWRRMNNNANVELRFVVGLSDDAIDVQSLHPMTSSSTPSAGIGLDWSSGNPDADCLFGFGAAGGAYGTVVNTLRKYPGIGYHTLCPLERGNTGATFYGDSAGNWRGGITALVCG